MFFLYRCCCTSVLLRLHSKGHHLKDLLIFLIFKFIYCCCCTSVFVRLHSKGTCPFVRHRSVLTPAANADSPPPTPPRIQNPDPTDRKSCTCGILWLHACQIFSTNANPVSPHSDLSGLNLTASPLPEMILEINSFLSQSPVLSFPTKCSRRQHTMSLGFPSKKASQPSCLGSSCASDCFQILNGKRTNNLTSILISFCTATLANDAESC